MFSCRYFIVTGTWQLNYTVEFIAKISGLGQWLFFYSRCICELNTNAEVHPILYNSITEKNSLGVKAGTCRPAAGLFSHTDHTGLRQACWKPVGNLLCQTCLLHTCNLQVTTSYYQHSLLIYACYILYVSTTTTGFFVEGY